MKKVYIETHGCQMNVHDTEKAVGVLAASGYAATTEVSDADLILLNTCMVREKAARKVFNRIGHIKHELSHSGTRSAAPLIGVMGCVAQAEAARIFDICSDVRLVVGTQSIAKLPDLLAQVEDGFPRAIDVRLSKDADFLDPDLNHRSDKFVGFISIIEGCNKFCSFCIVPFTRGRERSRAPERILAEARELADRGYKEIQLLGQNVNSYRFGAGGTSDAEQFTFADLLDIVAGKSGIPRIKYTTSFPRDFSKRIVEVMDAHENLCEWVHLPAQSGSDRVLRAMRRGYTSREYLEKIAYVRSARRDYSITGDIIVGFPGESDADFSETLAMVAEVGYDGLYIFKYSPRSRTPAAAYADSVPEEVKTERFLRLEELQDRMQKQRYERYLNREVEVLVQGTSARSEEHYSGHTKCNKVVNFAKGRSSFGEIVKVVVEQCHPHSLYGSIISKPHELQMSN
jgi:tRNA-2-methylthio-N6-dimethylallyladenosine synthase